MAAKPIAILANPKAGSGLSLLKLQEARRVLWGRKYEFFVPGSRDEFSRICSTLSPESYEAAIIVGGDGTLNVALRALVRNGKIDLPIYPFPVGTANDLAAEMQTPSDWSVVEDLIASQRFQKIDLIQVNGIPFATVAGIGIGAQLTAKLNAQREQSRILKIGLKHLRAPIYSALTLKEILTQKHLERDWIIDAGSCRQKIRASALFVCNQKKLGGNISVSEEASNSDNRFNVLVITATSKVKLIAALTELSRGHIPKKFFSFSTTTLTVESTDRHPIQVFGDGETLAEAPQLKFDIIPHGLSVYQGRGRGES